MILLIQNHDEYDADFRAMLQAFFPTVKIYGMKTEEAGRLSAKDFRKYDICFTALLLEEKARLTIEKNGITQFMALCDGDYKDRRHFRNKLKLAMYRVLSEYTERTLPWGSLTGMRPTKIAIKAFKTGKNKEEVIDIYRKLYDTSKEKALLAAEVAQREKIILSDVDPERDYALYIGIPFCPTRCLYCSFAAVPIAEYESIVNEYLESLKSELQYISMQSSNRKLISIYIGGGTPTSLSAKQLDILLTAVDETFDITSLQEYTVEAGRPDSITIEKLRVLKNHNVSRISINPQTMNEETLRIIGRYHTSSDIVRAFWDARKTGFRDINMDIIAGLPGEDMHSMRYTLDEIEKLSPDSLTVHSLAIKKTANLNQELDQYKDAINHDAVGMVRMAHERAEKLGLVPYYLYRQRNIAGNLENTGFVKPGLECRYNILIMEERIDIYAAGAGAVSRLVTYDRKSDTNVKTIRVENLKNIEEYIVRIDEMKERFDKALNERRKLYNELS